ncbi:MAG: thrombospondin type 3 repeat-containing protein [Magnetococcales bacterium]|nr:thrombospondin type 3 repeat-containing protein [Magnetococcales bacterium]
MIKTDNNLIYRTLLLLTFALIPAIAPTSASAGYTSYLMTTSGSLTTDNTNELVIEISNGSVDDTLYVTQPITINTVTLAENDIDRDGIPDSFETDHGLDPLYPGDADRDDDQDGLTNLEEFRKNTDPFNPDTDADGITDDVDILADIPSVPAQIAISSSGGHAIATRIDGSLWAWGSNSHGDFGNGSTQSSLTPTLTDDTQGYVAISTSHHHTLAVRVDGTVWAWGNNQNGQLGTGDRTDTDLPIQVTNLSDVIDIKAAGHTSMALKSDGTVWTWGANPIGALGNATTTDLVIPAQVSDLADVIAIAFNGERAFAIKTDGTLWGWGNNQFGRIGDGTTEDHLSPVQIPALSDVISVAVGRASASAVKEDGSVWAWGYNLYGFLGDGTTTSQLTPVKIDGLPNIDRVYMSETDLRTIAIGTDKSLWTWGDNDNGQLGDGTTTDRTTPIQISSLTDISKISMGTNCTLAILEDGTTWAWGQNYFGQLGNDTNVDQLSPIQIEFYPRVDRDEDGVLDITDNCPTDANIDQMDLDQDGQGDVCDLDDDGDNIPDTYEILHGLDDRSEADGLEDRDQDGLTNYEEFLKGSDIDVADTDSDGILDIDDISPITAPTSPKIDIQINNEITTAVKGDGSVWIWDNLWMMSPDLYLVDMDKFSPRQILGAEPTSNISSYYSNTPPYATSVVLKTDGTVWTLNAVPDEEPNYGTIPQQYTADRVVNLTDTISLATGSRHVLALKSDGTVWGWGYNNYGELGDGTTEARALPVQVLGLTNITEIHSADRHSLALKSDGTVWEWGAFYNNHTFEPYPIYQTSPAQVLGLTDINKLITTPLYSLAFKDDGTIWGWDYNHYGPLEDGTTEDKAPPVQIDMPTGIAEIISSNFRITFRKHDGTVWEWEYNNPNYSSVDPYMSPSSPVQVNGLSDILSISTGDSHTLALKSNGTVWAWGDNFFGQLGDGTSEGKTNPVQVSGISDVVQIFAGGVQNYALEADGTLWAWGNSEAHIYNEFTPKRIDFTISADRDRDGLLDTEDNCPNDSNTDQSDLDLDGQGDMCDEDDDNDGMSDAFEILYNLNPLSNGDSDEDHDQDGLSNLEEAQIGSNPLIADTDSDGQLDGEDVSPITPPLTPQISISGGQQHSIASRPDGTAWSWGSSSMGVLGNGDAGYYGSIRRTPDQISTLTDVVAVAAGNYHTLALKSDGTTWFWGNMPYPGDNHYAPIQMTNLSDITAISGGDSFSLALKSNGTVWSWGSNFYGQLGHGTTDTTINPIQIQNLTEITAISSGSSSSLALNSDGTVWAWGDNSYGQLGDETTETRLEPVQVTNLTDIIAIAAGNSHSLALKSDGTVWTWGNNSRGQLGQGITADAFQASQLPNLTNIVAIQAGTDYSMALDSDGSVWNWGYNDDGQLGDNTNTNRNIPGKITALSDIVGIAAANRNAFAFNSDGKLWAWGNNTSAQLGDDTQINRKSPTLIDFDILVDQDRDGIHDHQDNCLIDANSDQLDLDQDGQGDLCDGDDDGDGLPDSFEILHGFNPQNAGNDAEDDPDQDGLSNLGEFLKNANPHNPDTDADGLLDDDDYSPNTPIMEPEVSISMGMRHTIISKADGTVWVWGNNTNDQLGLTDEQMAAFGEGPISTPIQLHGLENTVSVSAGDRHTVAVTIDGAVWSWGGDHISESGFITTTKTPTRIEGFRDVTTVSLGSDHSIALKSDGTVWAWGRNNHGQLGDGTTITKASPVQALDLSDVIAIASGSAQSFAVKSDGTLWGWGNNDNGVIGDGTTEDHHTPVQISSLTDVISVTTGKMMTMALKSDGSVWAWGDNGLGWLGDNSTTDRLTPVLVKGLPEIKRIYGGHYAKHTIVIGTDDTVWSWGNNNFGQLGSPTEESSCECTKEQIQGLMNITALAMNNAHVLAYTEDGSTWGWGMSSYEIMGNGSILDSSEPIQVPLNIKADIDDDGTLDSFDNCPTESNTNQYDMDQDGVGNKCDDDIDGDGVNNLNDLAPWNPQKTGVARVTIQLSDENIGRVFNLNNGLDCGLGATECSVTMDNGSAIELTVDLGTDANQGHFVGWSEPTCGFATTCSVTITEDTTITAWFNPPLDNQELIEAARRMPPVLFDVDLPVKVYGGEAMTVKWSMVGYHASYQSAVALFDCDQHAEGECGLFYNDNVATTGKINSVGNISSQWSYGTIPARKSLFEDQLMVPDVSQPTEMVLRFYRINDLDNAADHQAISLLIPGGLQEGEYYGTTGRRLRLMVLPANTGENPTANEPTVNNEDDPALDQTKANILADAWSRIETNPFTDESSREQAARRMPPVLTDFDIPEQIIGGESYEIRWELLGYHMDYQSQIALFACDPENLAACGQKFEQVIYASNRLTSEKTDWTPWAYKGEESTSFEFTHTVTFPEVTEPTDFAIRLYRINDQDILEDRPVNSLLIPGGLPNLHYLDSSGRRVLVTVRPTPRQ